MTSSRSPDQDPHGQLAEITTQLGDGLGAAELSPEQRAAITLELGGITALAGDIGRPDVERAIPEADRATVSEPMAERRIGGWREITPERRLARRAAMIHGFDDFMGVLLDDKQEISGFVPTPHQPKLFGDVGSFLHLDPDADGTLAGYIKGPPGIGKTLVEAMSARAFGVGQVVHPDEPPLSALSLVPSRKVGKQTGADENRGFGKFAPGLDLGIYFGGEKVVGDVTVMTYKSFAALSPERREELSNRVDVIFGDEFHRAYGEQTAAAFKSFARGKLAIALTATPNYRESRTIETETGINHKITDISFRKGIEDGICNGAQVLALDGGGRVNVRFDRGIGEADVKHLMFDDNRNTLIVDFMRTMAEEGRTGIVRCVPGGGTLEGGITASSLHARMIAASASKQDIIDPQTGEKRKMRVKAVGNFQNDEENDRILEDYSNGLVDALTFTKYLIEGYDEDRVEYVFDTSPTTSEVDKDQLAGRGMRLKDILTLYVDLVDTYVGAGKKVRLFLDTFGERDFEQGRVIGRPGKRFGSSGRSRVGRANTASESKSGVSTDHKRTKVPSFLNAAAFSLLSLPANLRRAADALTGRTLAELTVIANRHDAVPDDWLPVTGLKSLEGLSMPTRMRVLEGREGIEMRQAGPKGQWFVPPNAEALLANVDTSVADNSLVPTSAIGISGELFLKLTDDPELGLTRIWTRTNTSSKKPGWHLSAEDNRRLNAYLRAEYPPIDPEVEISVPDLARRLGRHRTEVRTRIGRLNSKGANIGTYSKWTDRRKEATCLSLADAEVIAQSLGAIMPKDGVSIEIVAAKLDMDIDAARTLIGQSPFTSQKRGGPLKEGGYIDWFDAGDAPGFLEWAAKPRIPVQEAAVDEAESSPQVEDGPQDLNDGDVIPLQESPEIEAVQIALEPVPAAKPVDKPIVRPRPPSPPRPAPQPKKRVRKPAATPIGRNKMHEFDESTQDAVDLAASAEVPVRQVRVLIEKLVREGKLRDMTPATPRKRVGGRVSPHYRGDTLAVIQTALLEELEN